MRPPSRYVGRMAHCWHSIDRQLKGPTLSLGLIERLKALKLHGMAEALTDLVQQDSPAYQSGSPHLEPASTGRAYRAEGAIYCLSDEGGQVPSISRTSS